MTVVRTERGAATGRMKAWCEWFSADNNVNIRAFPFEALKAVS
jgi:hypothetical protein